MNNKILESYIPQQEHKTEFWREAAAVQLPYRISATADYFSTNRVCTIQQNWNLHSLPLFRIHQTQMLSMRLCSDTLLSLLQKFTLLITENTWFMTNYRLPLNTEFLSLHIRHDAVIRILFEMIFIWALKTGRVGHRHNKICMYNHRNHTSILSEFL